MEATDPKTLLKSSIVDWMTCDALMATKRAELRQLTQEKTVLSTQLLQIMKAHNLDVIDTSAGSIVYKQQRVKKAISTKYLSNVLNAYFEQDSENAQQLTKYILSNRQEQTKESLCRKSN